MTYDTYPTGKFSEYTLPNSTLPNKIKPTDTFSRDRLIQTYFINTQF